MFGGLQDPTNDPHASALLFFTRWITHFCAPVFVLLAGTSAGLMTSRKTPNELAAFLLKRGLWLLFIEVAVISTAFTFSPFGLERLGGHTLAVMQVLSAIGVSMIALAGMQFFGKRTCLIVGAVIVLGHNSLDPIWPTAGMTDAGTPLWVALHAPMGMVVGPFQIFFVYPFVPWVGVMLLGFSAAGLFQLPPAQRNAQLFKIGCAMIAAFIVLRAFDVYGDPRPWHVNPDATMATLISFINTTKYPPSLLYLLMTLGPAALFCASADRMHGWIKNTLVMYGRVPFAFYVAHFYLAHCIGVAIGVYQGFTVTQMMTFFRFNPKGFGLNLLGVYLVWISVVVILYPFCRWVAAVKARRSDWWLSYL